jgi:dTDP-4-amino-4,6-dideoxygalactose transaminase
LRGLETKIAARKSIRRYYEKALSDLPGLSFMPIPKWSEPNYWLTCIVIDPDQAATNRDIIHTALEADNIEANPLWKPMHLQPVFKDCPAFVRGVSERLFRDGLCLPSGSAMTESNLERVCAAVRRCYRSRPAAPLVSASL